MDENPVVADDSHRLVGPRRLDDAEATVILGLVAERQTARAQRDFQRADAIRDQLTRMGIVVEDSASGPPRWKYANR